jgi:hypothetical protein
MADAPKPAPHAVVTGDKVRFHYLKSHLFRVIHADGALGGLTPSADIFFTLYSQRAPIPQVTVQKIMPDGQLGDEITEEREQKDGIVREPEVGVVMNLATAKAFHQWLTTRIELADKTLQAQSQQQLKGEGKIQ